MIIRNCFFTLFATAMVIGCGKPMYGATASNSKITTPPTSAEVVRQDLTGYVFFDGKVVTPPGVQGVVYAPYDVPISEVLTSVGKKVNRGETIIKLSIPNVTMAVEQAQANLRSIQSSYAVAKKQYDGPVREAQRALSEAQAAEKAARLDVQNMGSADLAGATQARLAAEENLRQAQADLSANLLADRQALVAAEEYLKDARAGAKLANVKSPITGTVVELIAKPGMVAKSKEHLATITDLRALRIQGTLPPQHIELVKKGTKVLIALEGPNSDPIDGVVKDVSVLPPSEGQKSVGYLVVIDFNNDKGLVLPATTIKRLGVESGRVKDALVVPVAAVSKDKDGRNIVQVRKGKDWAQTFVEVGLTDGALIEIKSGVSEGDEVRVNSVTIGP